MKNLYMTWMASLPRAVAAVLLTANLLAPACGGPSTGGSGGAGGGNQGGSSNQGGSNQGGSGGSQSHNCPSLNLQPGASRPVPDVVISKIKPGDGIELHNTTNQAIDLAQARLYLCANFAYNTTIIGGGEMTDKTSIPAGGYIKLNWPAGLFPSNVINETRGELLLYNRSMLPSPSNVMDYVCWGSFTGGRKDMAAGGRDIYMGACAPALTNGTLARKSNTTGMDAESYDHESQASPADCPE